MAPPTIEPSDFAAFWQGRYDDARAVTPDVTLGEADHRGVRELTFSTWGDQRIGGWFTHPSGPVRSAVIVMHGYGGRSAPDPRWVPEDAAAIYPVARGLPTASLLPGVPSTGKLHVLHGIESREAYIHGGCVADIWCAISALEEILGAPLGRTRGGLPLGYFGPSFGGGMGALAAPWDDRIDAVSLYVPSHGRHRERLAEPSVGSGELLSAWVERHPESWSVIDYFDAATAAARINVPTIIAPAATDPAVPPVGQWAVAHAVPHQVRTIMPMTAGHLPYPQEETEMAAYARATRDLFSASVSRSSSC